MIRDRRQFLSWGLAAAALPTTALYPARARAAARLSLVPLTGRLSLVQGGAANIVVAAASDGLLLVDGGAAADAPALQKLLKQHYPGKPLRAVFNTHWHWAQSGFNATARHQGADVLAHENTKLWLSTRVDSRWENRIYKPQPAAALPNRTFYYGPQTLDFGGSKVEYVHLGQAHTDGDIHVRFPEENVIVTGDVLSPGRYPIPDAASNGWLGGINGALKTIGAVSDGSTRLVPGSGPVVGLDVLKRQQEMGESVVNRIGDNYRKAGSFAEFIATSPTREFDAQYGDPALFLRLAYETAFYQVKPRGVI